MGRNVGSSCKFVVISEMCKKAKKKEKRREKSGGKACYLRPRWVRWRHSVNTAVSRTVVQSKFFGDYDERGERWSGYTGFRGPSNRLFKITDKLAGQHTMMTRLLRKHMLYLSAVGSPL